MRNISSLSRASVKASMTHEHRVLMHQGYHLVPHSEANIFHGYGGLVCVLIGIHLLAIGFWVFMMLRSQQQQAKQGKRKLKDIPADVRCEYGWGPTVPGSVRSMRAGAGSVSSQRTIGRG